MITIAFDVDGTLIHQIGEKEDTPKYEVIQFLISFLANNDDVCFWSGGGIDYAQRWAIKLGFIDLVKIVEKGSFVPDLCFDDQDVNLGKVNIKV